MIEYDFRKVKLKPFYKIVKTDNKVFIMMPPMEVIEIPQNITDNNKLLDQLCSDEGLILEEIIKEINENSTVANLLKELWTHGFLMSLDGAELLPPQEISTANNWLPFLCRFTNKPYEVFFRFGNTKMGLFTQNLDFGLRLQKILRNITFLPETINIFSGDSCEMGINEIDFGIALTKGFYPAFFLKLNQKALDLDKPLLPIILLPDTLLGIVGPLIKKGEGPCWNCFYKRYSSQGINLEIYDLLSKFQLSEKNDTYFWNESIILQLILPEMIFAITDIGIPKTLGGVLYFDFLNYTISHHNVLVLPRCEFCSSVDTAEANSLYSPFSF